MPKVKPLGTQPDQRPEAFSELIGAGMMRKNIAKRSQLARAIGVSYETLNDRLKYPWTFKLGEMLKLMDTLEIPAEDFEKVFYRRR